MNRPQNAPRRTRVLYLFNVPEWAIHNVGRDWAELLRETHDFTLMRFGQHEREDPEAYDHVVWGYSTLDYSGRMLLQSLLQRPLGWLRWRLHSARGFAAVVQDPSEIFPEVADWKHARPRLAHRKRFERLAVTSNEMSQVMQGLGYAVTQVRTHSLLPLREAAAIAREPLRVFTRAQEYPRKNLALFRALQARFTGKIERFDAVVGGGVMPQAEYVRQIDGYNAYVCTSWQEGGPLPLMDAMRRGCVVLTTAVGQTDELIEDGVNGFFCTSESEFTARLEQLAADPALLHSMRLHSFERAGQRDEVRERAELQRFLP